MKRTNKVKSRRQAEKQRPIPVLQYDIDEQVRQTLSVWSKNFSNPARAEQLFIEMYAEKPKTALWYANHRANVFGECESIPETTLTDTKFVLAKIKHSGIRNILHIRTKPIEIER